MEPAELWGAHDQQILSIAISAIAANSALAADYKAGLLVPYYNWSGFYIGGHAGNAWDRMQGSESFTTGFIGQRIREWIAGAQIGVNHQIGRAVIKLELSGDGDINGTSSDCLSGSVIPIGELICKTKQKWSAQLLARFGYAVGDGRFLPYALGGIAFTEFDATIQVLGNPPVTDGPGSFNINPGGDQRSIREVYWVAACNTPSGRVFRLA
jgi:outer membrane immunogenic protein